MKLIQTFKNEGYNSGIGPGLYDIHSPRVPSEEEMKEKVKTMLEILDANNFFINPDCGEYYVICKSTQQEAEADPHSSSTQVSRPEVGPRPSNRSTTWSVPPSGPVPLTLKHLILHPECVQRHCQHQNDLL